MATKSVDVTLADTKGCTIHIKGDVKYSLVPPSVDGFKGTIELGGGPSCPKGTLTFAMVAPTKPKGNFVTVTVIGSDLSQVQGLLWKGTTDLGNLTAKQLNAAPAKRALVGVMRAAPIANIKNKAFSR